MKANNVKMFLDKLAEVLFDLSADFDRIAATAEAALKAVGDLAGELDELRTSLEGQCCIRAEEDDCCDDEDSQAE